MAVVVGVVLENTSLSYDKLYSYSVPEELSEICKPGCRIVVPFGKGNTYRQGIVLEIKTENNIEKLKNIIRVVDDTPIIGDEMVKLCMWLHDRLFCTYFDIVNVVLPTGISLKMVDFYSVENTENIELEEDFKQVFDFILKSGNNVSYEKIVNKFGTSADSVILTLLKKGYIKKNTDAVRKMNDLSEKSVRIKSDYSYLAMPELTKRQTEIFDIISKLGEVSVKELQYYTGVSVSVINSLVKKGILEYFNKPVYRVPVYNNTSSHLSELVLTDEQTNAFEKLKKLLFTSKSALLYGVTGSGKTKVFLKLVDEVIASGKGVIIMVPEISLTTQTISLFGSRYGGEIAVFHSSMSLGQRMDEWKRIRDGKAKIAIGTRSAIFAPFKEIGLIIIDEEHEHTYKSEQSPRFYTHDIAKFRSRYHNCMLLMASATPSLTTYSKAVSGKYELCTLLNRYGNAELPEVITVDMRKEIQSGNTGILSNELYNQIENALNSSRQAIVLLNRRGHNTYISCTECGYVATCPNCSVSLTYHSANNRLMCHYCGYSLPYSKKCANCGSDNVRFSGAGTQKAEDELKSLFKDARILRLDADSTIARGSMTECLNDFSNGKYDILLGTQMVAKGLDFPNVTVVGVIGADLSAQSSDYKSNERTFSLLTQVIGRAGRGKYGGVAVLQTNDPENSVIELAKKQDYIEFYKSEAAIRKLLVYPPYCDIILVTVQSVSQNSALCSANTILGNLKNLVSDKFSDVKIIALGPVPAGILKLNNKYRYLLTVKCKNTARTRELIRTAVSVNINKEATVTVDINPESNF